MRDVIEDVTTTLMTGEACAAKKIADDASRWKLAKRALHDLGATDASGEPTSRAALQSHDRTWFSAHGA